MKVLRTIMITICLSVISSLSVHATEISPNYEKQIDEIAEIYIGETVPGACIMIAEQGELIFSKGYGYADLEREIPMNPETTVFEWGSITKTFVWVSVMQQVEQGNIDLHENIVNYLPKGFLSNLAFDEPVTMLHLMNHTAGFEDQLLDLRYGEGDVEISLSDALLQNQPKQIYTPGTVSAYSNWGSALAAYIVEQVSGQDFAEYVSRYILSPLSMEHTALKPFWSDASHILEQKATGYSFMGDAFKLEDEMMFKLYPAGSFIGTATDLLKFANALAISSQESSLLFQNGDTSSSLFSETHRSFGANAGLSHGFWQYVNESSVLGHEGGTYGFKTQMWIEPETGRAIVILTNVMYTSFCSDIMEALFYTMTEKDSVNIDNDITRLEGEYLPARNVVSHVGNIQGITQLIQIKTLSDNQIVLTMPLQNIEYVYEQIAPFEFYCASAPPEDQNIGFVMEEEEVILMSFRLAHDYLPSIPMQRSVVMIGTLLLYIASLLFWIVYFLIQMYKVIKNKAVKIPYLLPGTMGSIVGIVGIYGVMSWILEYNINSSMLNGIVILNFICMFVTFISSLYVLIRKDIRTGSMFLVVLILQVLALGNLGFFTMV